MPSDERRRAAARAAPLSLPEGPPALPWPSLPSRCTRENTLSLSPPVSSLPSSCSAVAAAFSSPRHTVVVVGRSLSVRCSRTDGHMRASTRLWWLLIPPGASLVTHAARRGSLDPLESRAPHPGLSLRQAHASPTRDWAPFSLFFSLSLPVSSIPPLHTGAPAAIPVGRHR